MNNNLFNVKNIKNDVDQLFNHDFRQQRIKRVEKQILHTGYSMLLMVCIILCSTFLWSNVGLVVVSGIMLLVMFCSLFLLKQKLILLLLIDKLQEN